MSPLMTALDGLIKRAESYNIEISEFTLSKSQVDSLYAGTYRVDESVAARKREQDPATVNTIFGVRIKERPEPLTPGQRAAAALRKLADDLEKQQ